MRTVRSLSRLSSILSHNETAPLTPSLSPSEGERVPFRAGEGFRGRKRGLAQGILSLLLALMVAASFAQSADKAAKPNIILILADDLGAKELSCYGSKQYRTPNLDRMASEGVRFETFFATPLCTPTRMALMTGQYGFRNGFLGMQDPAFKPAPDSPQASIGNHFTHADLLKSAGYATALSGKWQLAGKLPTLVYDAGFDEYLMWAYPYNLPPGIKHPAYPRGNNDTRYWKPCLLQNGKYRPTTPEEFGPDLFNEFVLDFARRHKQQPFFVYYTSVLTHGPRVETPDPNNPGKFWPAGLKSNLEYLDYLMGKLFAGLKAEGLDENTLVIFIGDNGTAGEGKNEVTEAGARVPCIIRGPGVKRGVLSRAPGDLTDIMATLADFSGATLPTNTVFDGHSLGPVLRGEKAQHRDWIYSHLDDGRILRDSRWLLEIEKAGKGERFYDCGESRDGTGYKDVTHSTDAEVKAARARFAQILASMPEPKPRPGVERPAARKQKKGKSQDE
jgi:arylsulfatase A